TNSTDLPTSASSGQPEYAGGASDGFIAYFNTGTGVGLGNPLVLSYYGTSADDRITAASNNNQACAFAGWTTGRGLKVGSPTFGFPTAPLLQIGTGGGA